MMVVTVEIWPGGDESTKYTIGTMKIANVNGQPVSDYSVEIEQQATPRIGVEAIAKAGTVVGHPRSDGPWALVRRALSLL